MITVDFSETFAASDLKTSRSRHLIDYMKICAGKKIWKMEFFPGQGKVREF